MDAIEIKNLSFSYPGSLVKNLDGVNLKVQKGDFLAIIGSNGCGKSTLCKSLNGLIPHSIQGDFDGSVKVNGINVLESSIASLSKEIGYVYQDFENQIVRPTVLDDASYAPLNYGDYDYINKGLRSIDMVNLNHKKDDFVWEISGGQTHLLALAGVLAIDPSIIVIDEPIAQLDLKNADNIYRILKVLNEKYNKTIIVIEHSTEHIAKYCKSVCLMDKGSILWKLDTNEALLKIDDLKNHDIFPPQVTRAGLLAKKKRLIDYDKKLPINIDQAKEFFEDFSLVDKKDKESKEKKEVLLSLKNIDLSFKNMKNERKIVFDDLNLDIHRGEKVGLLGPNGAGKSTTLKLLMGLVKPDVGDVLIKNQNIKDIDISHISNLVSLVYQNPEQMFIEDSVYDEIVYALKERDIEDYEKRAENLIKKFRLNDLKERDARLLSGGQMRRVSLAIGSSLNLMFYC